MTSPASGTVAGRRPTADSDAEMSPVDRLVVASPRDGRPTDTVVGLPGPLGAPVTWYVAAPVVSTS